MSSYRIGMNLRVTEDSKQGGRRYMEDRHAIRFVKNVEGGFEFAYFGIFDGHGGGEASKYARDNLLDEITKYDCFWGDNDDDILYAIKSAFLDTHYGMWRELEKWPMTSSGLPSTAGTTASICIIKNSKLYIGHVGDSGVVLGYNESKNEKIVRPKAKMLTIEHKPDDPKERKRIEDSGGQVVAKSGVQRVVWNRPKSNHKGPIRRSTPIDKIPFLAVARSLGDLWSYNYLKEEFVVSPNPDVSVYTLDPDHDKCLVIGSDGLWNMLSSEEAVNMVVDLEYQFEDRVINDPTVPVSYWINPAERLVQHALNKWRMRLMKADNTSAIVVLIDPLGPRKLSILKKKREEKMQEMSLPHIVADNKATELLTAKESLQKSPRKSAKDKAVKPLAASSKPVSPSAGKPASSLPRRSTSPIPVSGHVLRHERVVSDNSYKNQIHQMDDRPSIQSLMQKFTDNMDDSVQVRNAHLASPATSYPPQSKKSDVKLTKPVSPSPKLKSSVSPLQTSVSENVCRSGMVTRSSPHKSLTDPNSLGASALTSATVNKTKKEQMNSTTRMQVRSSSVQSNQSGSASTIASPKCLQPCKQTAVISKHQPSVNVHTADKVKDVENIFSNPGVQLSLKNLNIGQAQKGKNVKNVNNSHVSDHTRGVKKSHGIRHLSSRISLRLRKLRSKSKLRNVGQAENKGFEGRTGVKRKMESSSGTPATKKLRHS